MFDCAVESLALETLEELIKNLRELKPVTKYNDSTDCLILILLSLKTTIRFEGIEELGDIVAGFSKKQVDKIQAQKSDETFFDSLQILTDENPMKKTLFIRPHPGRSAPPGELQIGWVFEDKTGSSGDIVFGSIGLGKGEADQEERLQRTIKELRVQQKSIGNDSDFGIDDRRKKPDEHKN